MEWSCPICTLINHSDCNQCKVCSTDRIIKCSACTFDNSWEATQCALCGNSLKTMLSSKRDISSINLANNDQENDLNRLFDIADRYFDDFVESAMDAKRNKFIFKCKLDNRICSARNMMLAYLCKHHKATIEERDDKQRKMKSEPKYIESDYDLAMRMACDDFDELQTVQKSNRMSSSTNSSFSYKTVPKPLKSSNDANLSTKTSYERNSEKIRDVMKQNKKLPSSLRDEKVKSPKRMKIRDAEIKSSEENTNYDDYISKADRLKKLLSLSDNIACKVQTLMHSSQTTFSHPLGMDSNLSRDQKQPSSKPLLATESCSSPAPPPFTSSSISSSSLCSKFITLPEQYVLHDYQQQGVEWLYHHHMNSVNSILADDMGLGKTIQIIVFLRLIQARCCINGPHIIVAPLSVLGAWKNELEKLCLEKDNLNLLVYIGASEKRLEEFREWRKNIISTSRSGSGLNAEVVSNEKATNRGRKSTEVKKTPVDNCLHAPMHILLTSYQMILKDCDVLQRIGKNNRWGYCIVDEAHRLKNSKSVLYNLLTQNLHAHRYILLTGTPLQNNVIELWSLLHFILPKIFHNFDEFKEWFNSPFDIKEDEEAKNMKLKHLSKKKKTKHNKPNLFKSKHMNTLSDEEKSIIVSALHRVLKPFILRRTKDEVLPYMVSKVEKIVLCPLSVLQIHLYNMIVYNALAKSLNCDNNKDNVLSIDLVTNGKNSSAAANISYSNVVMQLRKICCHPFILLEDMKSIPDDLYYQDIVSCCGKLAMLQKLLTLLLSEDKNRKVLIFSQMTSMLTILEGFLEGLNISCSRLDGDTARVVRESVIESFNRQGESSETSTRVFLLSTRAGGVGINLQVADTVILYDSDWNPQMDSQAIARSHRIGQNKKVLVLRLVSCNRTSSNDDDNDNGSGGDGGDGTKDMSGIGIRKSDDAMIQKNIADAYKMCVRNKWPYDKLPVRLWHRTIEEKMLTKALHKLETEKIVLQKGKFNPTSELYKSMPSSPDVEKEEMKEMLLGKEEGDMDLASVIGSDNNIVIDLSHDEYFSDEKIKDACVRDTQRLVKDINGMEYFQTEKNALDTIRWDDWKTWLEDGVENIVESRSSDSLVKDEDTGDLLKRRTRRAKVDVGTFCEAAMWKKEMDRAEKEANTVVEPKAKKSTKSNLPKTPISKKRPIIEKEQAEDCNSATEDDDSNSDGDDDVDSEDDADSAYGSDDGTDEDNDICAICGQENAGVGFGGDAYSDDEMNLQEEIGSGRSGEKNEEWGKNDFTEDKFSSKNVSPELLTTLILCDKCDEQSHLFCAGLDKVPSGDWYCRKCEKY